MLKTRTSVLRKHCGQIWNSKQE